ncbi:MAG: hypothetical protein GY938_31910 [Ketobacter sp.]|nr:hypothetical protein [Ketobacter sp.]
MNDITAVPFRTPACDKHLDNNESDICPWCECEMLLALLDRIEIEQDYTLARQRFDIAESLGYTVVMGEPISGRKQ